MSDNVEIQLITPNGDDASGDIPVALPATPAADADSTAAESPAASTPPPPPAPPAALAPMPPRRIFDPGPPLDRPLKQIVTEAAAEIANVIDQVDSLKQQFIDAKADLIATGQQQATRLRDEVSKQLDDAKTAIDENVATFTEQATSKQAEFDAKQKQAAEDMANELSVIRDEFASMTNQITSTADELKNIVDEKLGEITARLETVEEAAVTQGATIEKQRKDSVRQNAKLDSIAKTTRICLAGIAIAIIGVIIAIATS